MANRFTAGGYSARGREAGGVPRGLRSVSLNSRTSPFM
jgi:hypothetical protein